MHDGNCRWRSVQLIKAATANVARRRCGEFSRQTKVCRGTSCPFPVQPGPSAVAAVYPAPAPLVTPPDLSPHCCGDVPSLSCLISVDTMTGGRTTLDQRLLGKAREAASRHEEAQREALIARAEYHTAIRRLHLAGAPLREIAQALSWSHQRVQRIVSGAGGTWWSGAWRARRIGRDAVCTWCGRPPSEVAKLVAGPGVYICDGCIDAADRVARGVTTRGPFSATARRASLSRCAFCSRSPGGGRTLVRGKAASICTVCLETCRQIAASGSARR